MVNTEDFIKRIEILLDYYSLNASSFADKIGVQRSSLSHLLSGRNKPSLDFILKILDVFPEVDLYWILNGKGIFPKNKHNTSPDDNVLVAQNKPNAPTPTPKEIEPENLFSEIQNGITQNNVDVEKRKKEPQLNETPLNEVEKIVFFYTNGTFKVFHPNT
ncbi:helix-turn-helix domain-containing protein [Flavobacterium restrictum]|uniref:Helix-turn-helix transcriptional regulator n=1 Tax=Flavobacterium restrictum TaxID=2594428 RepID=A0A553DZU7_9FLAO|nr:helix-turn-helix transcriptional regulator [Flavobacterium restrictum]TRX38327.1 helix-turn-helix transcriptional regulator [Flavobacterium restrictum]